MKKNLYLLFLLLTCTLFAQEGYREPCLSDQIIDNLIRENPEVRERIELMEKEIGANRSARSSNMSMITIPVVVYIVHGGVNNPENISDNQVHSQIAALNDYFLDYGLKFCLATKAGTGTTSIPLKNGATDSQATPGIIHVLNAALSNNTFATAGALANTAHHTITASRYLRIWVVNKIENGDSVKGYATFPNVGSFDGIVMRYDVFGTSACSGCNLDPLFQQGKTLVHEIGHYLGLYHTFYESCTESDCSSNGDRVCDTPPAAYANYSCSITDTCPGDGLPDDVLNYMDYGNECSSHFTVGQLTRMMGVLHTQRTQLFSNSNLIFTGPCGNIPISAAFVADQYTVCDGTSVPVQFSADSQAGVTYSWEFGDGNTYISTSSNTATNLYNSAVGSPFTVTLTATNTATGEQVTSEEKIFVTLCTPINNSGSRWFVGTNDILNFSSGIPVFDPTFTPTGAAAKATAIQNDSSGNLLFYTDKQFIYNASYNKTNPNSPLLTYSHSGMRKSNSVLIVPRPVVTGSPSQYYIFTNSHVDGQPDNGFKYSIVNSSGLLTSTYKIAVTTPSGYITSGADNAVVGGGGITAIQKSDGYWIITTLMKHVGANSPGHFLVAYSLTASGLVYRSAVQIPVFYSEGGGMRVKVSPDGNRIVVGTYFNNLYLYDFNKITGTIMSNPSSSTDLPIPLNGIGHTVDGIAFSPNSKLLYIAVDDKLYQYNLLLQNPVKSRVIVGTYFKPENPGTSSATGFGEIQAGPDGKLYITTDIQGPLFPNSELSVIHKPNELASADNPFACQFSMHGPGNATANVYDELPNLIVANNPTVYNNTISYYPRACGSYRFFPNIVGAVQSSTYTWEVKNTVTGVVLSTAISNVYTKTFTATQEGTYTVSVKSGSTVLASVTNIVIDFPDPPVILGSENACSTSNQPSHNSVVLQEGDSAVWSVIGGSGVFAGPNNQAEATINWKSLPGTIKVVVTNDEGCVRETVKIIESTCPAGANDYVTSVKNYGNQKFYFAGNFTKYNNVTKNRIARLNTDMGLDESFDAGAGTNTAIHEIALQSNGRILIGGAFTDVNGNSRTGIARLLSTGAFDTSFLGSGVSDGVGSASVDAIAVASSQKIVIGGSFTEYSGAPAYSVVRLNADGSKDLTFNSTALLGLNWHIFDLAIQADSKIIICGRSGNDIFNPGPSVMRLNADGTIDSTFAPLSSTMNNSVTALKLLSTGKILVGGRGFFNSGSNTYSGLLRLNANGTIDTTFAPDWVSITGNASVGISAIEILPDGKIVIAGGFWWVGSPLRRCIARLTSNGQLDPTFDPEEGFEVHQQPRGATAHVASIALYGENLVTGGSFNKYNEIYVNHITKINMTTNTIIGRPGVPPVEIEADVTAISVYPNPASEFVTVSSTDIDIDTVAIYNALGQLIGSQKVSKGENIISLQQLSSGVYFLKIMKDGQVAKSERIIKK